MTALWEVTPLYQPRPEIVEAPTEAEARAFFHQQRPGFLEGTILRVVELNEAQAAAVYAQAEAVKRAMAEHQQNERARAERADAVHAATVERMTRP